MSNLNKKQFEAVETVNGPVVIIAGPGTGKTKTLVERTVNILVNKEVEAKKIMITTFTNKAAKELELRINERLEELNKNMIIVLDDIERENDTNKIYESILFLGELSEHFKDTKTTTLLLAQHSYLEDKLKEINDRIILATLHYGFFHISMYPIIDEPMFIIVRPVPNKFIEAYMNKIRFKKNMLSFTEQNIKALFKYKKSKGFFIMLNDVRKPDGEKVTFFNLPTTASGFTAFFSIRENLPIIVIHNEVDSNNICNIYINEIIYPENYTDKNNLTDKLLKVYEKIILNNPEQWYFLPTHSYR